MKKYLALSFLLILFLSCQDDRLKLFQSPSSSTVDIQVAPSFLTFEATDNTKGLTITNNGTELVTWQLQSSASYLSMSPSSGSLKAGQSIITTVKVDRVSLAPKTYNETLNLNTVGGTSIIPITINQSISVQFAPASLVFGFAENSQQFSIKNTGNFDLAWQVQSVPTYLSVSPGSGTLKPNESATLSAVVTRTSMVSQVYTGSIAFKMGAGTSSLPFSIDNFQETKWLLTGQVIDAEYDRTNNNLVVVTNENKLLILKPDTKSMSTILLPWAPTCVAVGMNGQYAVVGYDGHISLVNISSLQIEQNYAVSANVLDVVLAPNFWAYAFPKVDQWCNIHCIDLHNGSETLNTGRQIYAGTKAKLHPSGKFIYGANNGLSPSDAEKYDIQAGQANFLYDSRYHGDYAFSGDLWISDNGSTMFTRGRSVFSLSENSSLDISYGGTIPGNGVGIKTLDQMSSKNLVYAVPFDFMTDSPQNLVKVYTSDFLTDLGSKPLPDFVNNDPSGTSYVKSEGHYGFFNSSGTNYYVLVRSSKPIGLVYQWAVATVTVN